MPFLDANGLRLHYREAGDGPPVLLLHGWPTSSFLYREVMRPIARSNRVIALDLPGFGQSDKPTDRRYTFRFYDGALDGALEALGVDDVGLCVHDLGGPVGLHWAVRNRARVRELALLNTLVYPELGWAVVAFGAACRVPGLRGFMTSERGLKMAMRVGMARRDKLTDELYEGVVAPFRTREARRALLDSALSLSPRGMREIGQKLGALECPVRIVYGARDRILPDVADTMARVARDLPQAVTTCLPDAGHFLQEDEPEEVGRLLAELFAPDA